MDVDQLKELFFQDELGIKFRDEIASITNEVISKTSEENFPIDQDWSEDEFKSRIAEFENIASDLCSVQIFSSYWGNEIHRRSLSLPMRMIGDYWLDKSGKRIWKGLPWYINLLLFYYTGISSVASQRYENIRAIADQVIEDPVHHQGRISMLQAVLTVCRDFEEQFKLISGNPRHYVPRSEYLFGQLNSKLEELLYIGSDYESYFDEFEILVALEYAHQTTGGSPDVVRVPFGRFAYKQRSNDNPLSDIIEKANSMEDRWPPIVAGLIGGNYKRFQQISSLLVDGVEHFPR